MTTKTIVYNLILNYSLDELLKGKVYFLKLDYRRMKKKSDSTLKSYRKSNVNTVKDTLKQINKNSRDLKRVSHEMLTIIAIDWLVNIERDTTARVNYGHLPIVEALDGMMQRFKEDMKQHYKFFESIVKSIKE